MFELILYSAFWYIIGAVSAVLFVDALRIRAEIRRRSTPQGLHQAKMDHYKGIMKIQDLEKVGL